MTLKGFVASRLRPLFQNYVYRVRSGIAKGLKRKGGLGFFPQIVELNHEEKFIMDLDLSGQTVYDIGGWEGVFSVFFGRKVGPTGHVFTFEPNPKNYSRILENIELNHFKNIKVINIGLGQVKEKSKLIFDSSYTGMGSLPSPFNNHQPSKKTESIEVEVDSLDSVAQQKSLGKPDFVKIDVEGYELNVLLGMTGIIRKHKPRLFIEIHGIDMEAKSKNIKEVFSLLNSMSYKIVHIETGLILNSENTDIAREGHLYCT